MGEQYCFMIFVSISVIFIHLFIRYSSFQIKSILKLIFLLFVTIRASQGNILHSKGLNWLIYPKIGILLDKEHIQCSRKHIVHYHQKICTRNSQIFNKLHFLEYILYNSSSKFLYCCRNRYTSHLLAGTFE